MDRAGKDNLCHADVNSFVCLFFGEIKSRVNQEIKDEWQTVSIRRHGK